MKKSFTLVETLIVIAVFGTGILTVLYGISQTLGNQDKAKTEITTSFLAREGIELMYHLRDSNYRKKLPRNCVFEPVNITNAIDIDANPYCLDYFTGGMVLKLSMDPENYVKAETGTLSASFETDFQNFQLFYATGTDETPPFQYVYTGVGGAPLRYARYVLIKPVIDEGTLLPTDKILKIESHVLFQKGSLTGEKVMETFIGNYEI
jgi:type II secretory pathway pseudopilin PulG